MLESTLWYAIFYAEAFHFFSLSYSKR